MDEQPEVECTECGWDGYYSELICRDEDLDNPAGESRYDVCPQCGGVDTWQDYDADD